MAKKKTSAKRRSAPPADMTTQLETLLHTVRCIAQHEDELCTLLHSARRKGRITSGVARDLKAILRDLPAEEYAFEVNALQLELKAA